MYSSRYETNNPTPLRENSPYWTMTQTSLLTNVFLSLKIQFSIVMSYCMWHNLKIWTINPINLLTGLIGQYTLSYIIKENKHVIMIREKSSYNVTIWSFSPHYDTCPLTTLLRNIPTTLRDKTSFLSNVLVALNMYI